MTDPMTINPAVCQDCGGNSRRWHMVIAGGRLLCYPCARKVVGNPIRKPAHSGEQRSDG